MDIKNAEFITSAPNKSHFPEGHMSQIAFVGRSNVGKSSLINSLVNIKQMARVSSTPGRTRLVNFFLINKKVYFVDLPGYGFAKVSKIEKAGWTDMIEGYLTNNVDLKLIVLLIDSRREPTEEDLMMFNWFKHYNYKVLVVATKVDKLNRNEMVKNSKLIKDNLHLTEEDYFVKFSALKRIGREEIIDIILKEAENEVEKL